MPTMFPPNAFGPDMAQPTQPAQAPGMLPPELQAQILALSGKQDQQALLEQQLAQAEALRDSSGPRRTSIGGQLFGGVAGAVRGVAGNQRAARAREALGANSQQQSAARQAYVAQALGASTPEAKQRLIAMGLLSGDATLGKYAQSELDSQKLKDTQAFTEKIKGLEFGHDSSENKLNRDLEREKMTAAEKAAQAKADADRLKTGEDLRSEFNRLPQTQRLVLIKEAVQQIQNAAPGGAGDLALIYGISNALDPGAVVRESDVTTVGKTGGLPGVAQGYFNQLTAQGFLSDDVRANIKKEALSILGSREKAFEPTRNYYRSEASRRGLNPDEIFLPITTADTAEKKVINGKTYQQTASGQWAEVLQ